MCTLIISGASCSLPSPISYTNWTGYYICLKLNHEKWRLDLKNFNKDKLLLSLNQGMLIGAFIWVAADNVTLAWGSYFAIKHLHSNDFIIAYTGCQRETNWAADPSFQPLPFKSPANCISYQLIVLLSSWPSGKPGPTTMRCLLLEESVFNHFCLPVLFCLQCINKCFK